MTDSPYSPESDLDVEALLGPAEAWKASLRPFQPTSGTEVAK